MNDEEAFIQAEFPFKIDNETEEMSTEDADTLNRLIQREELRQRQIHPDKREKSLQRDIVMEFTLGLSD